MKAKLEHGDVVTVEVLRVKSVGFFFPVSWSLVEYNEDVIDNDGNIKYTNKRAEWVLTDDVFTTQDDTIS